MIHGAAEQLMHTIKIIFFLKRNTRQILKMFDPHIFATLQCKSGCLVRLNNSTKDDILI